VYEQIAAVYGDVVGDLPYGAWADFVERSWASDPQPVHRVLDLCCGTGLLTAELVARGYALVGADGSAEMLEEARRLLGPAVPLHRRVLPALDGDGLRPDGPGSSFDAVVSTFDSLNYLTLPDFAATVAAVARLLRTGGWFVLDLHTEAMMRAIAAAPRAEARSGALDLVMDSAVDLATRTVTTTVTITPDDRPAFAERHVQHFFTVDDVRATATAAGLSVVSVTEDYTEAPLDDGALRATWVLRRH